MRALLQQIVAGCGALAGQLGELKTEMGEMTTEMGEMTSDMGAMKTEMGEMTSEMGEMTSEMGEMTSEMREMKTEMGAMKSEMTTRMDNIDATTAELAMAALGMPAPNYRPEEKRVTFQQHPTYVEAGSARAERTPFFETHATALQHMLAERGVWGLQGPPGVGKSLLASVEVVRRACELESGHIILVVELRFPREPLTSAAPIKLFKRGDDDGTVIEQTLTGMSPRGMLRWALQQEQLAVDLIVFDSASRQDISVRRLGPATQVAPVLLVAGAVDAPPERIVTVTWAPVDDVRQILRSRFTQLTDADMADIIDVCGGSVRLALTAAEGGLERAADAVQVQCRRAQIADSAQSIGAVFDNEGHVLSALARRWLGTRDLARMAQCAHAYELGLAVVGGIFACHCVHRAADVESAVAWPMRRAEQLELPVGRAVVRIDSAAAFDFRADLCVVILVPPLFTGLDFAVLHRDGQRQAFRLTTDKATVCERHDGELGGVAQIVAWLERQRGVKLAAQISHVGLTPAAQRRFSFRKPDTDLEPRRVSYRWAKDEDRAARWL